MTDKKRLNQKPKPKARTATRTRERCPSSAPPTAERPVCRVRGCGLEAAVEVLLHDEYPNGVIFHERDFTCPFLCDAHKRENEAKARGQRRPRGVVYYPYTNAHMAQGWSMYRPL